eukprot:3382403-Rhodomonas_salina.1
MVFLHSEKTGAEVVRLMRKARAKACYWPACMRSDGDPAYNCPEVQQLFADNNIDHQWSNAEQQFQNAASETV